MVRTGKRLASVSKVKIDFQKDSTKLRTNTSTNGSGV
jgi:hypothetical protein